MQVHTINVESKQISLKAIFCCFSSNDKDTSGLYKWLIYYISEQYIYTRLLLCLIYWICCHRWNSVLRFKNIHVYIINIMISIFVWLFIQGTEYINSCDKKFVYLLLNFNYYQSNSTLNDNTMHGIIIYYPQSFCHEFYSNGF